MTLIDPTGFLLTGIRNDMGVAAITSRIRGGEPRGRIGSDPGDARGPGEYVPFVVLAQLGRSRLKRAPIGEWRYVARCYGVTFQAADMLAAAVSDAIHAVGIRTSGSGVVIFGSFDDGSQGTSKDPDTGQPMAALIISVGALTETVP